jgi:hypothetical protein
LFPKSGDSTIDNLLTLQQILCLRVRLLVEWNTNSGIILNTLSYRLPVDRNHGTQT